MINNIFKSFLVFFDLFSAFASMYINSSLLETSLVFISLILELLDLILIIKTGIIDKKSDNV